MLKSMSVRFSSSLAKLSKSVFGGIISVLKRREKWNLFSFILVN